MTTIRSKVFFAFFWTGFALVLGSFAVMTGDVRRPLAMCVLCLLYALLFGSSLMRARRRWLGLPNV